MLGHFVLRKPLHFCLDISTYWNMYTLPLIGKWTNLFLQIPQLDCSFVFTLLVRRGLITPLRPTVVRVTLEGALFWRRLFRHLSKPQLKHFLQRKTNSNPDSYIPHSMTVEDWTGLSMHTVIMAIGNVPAILGPRPLLTEYAQDTYNYIYIHSLR